MNTNVAKLIALTIVGSVAKALFANPKPVIKNYYSS